MPEGLFPGLARTMPGLAGLPSVARARADSPWIAVLAKLPLSEQKDMSPRSICFSQAAQSHSGRPS